ncbi:transmembrane transporter component (plasmid) [Azospirillum sp. B510]|uniref:ABC transporter permease n=1 Tax=Azospirillum sp. (strain B510) TaxID=137722 RepID=UPI0001C4C869|nr:ABC transporter permease [Azospirillum sp. B510]BAI75643.1 transmembrane transporter component [Azospirillum sp. B510]
MIAFILADLWRFRAGAAAVVLLLALSVALSVTVTLQERALRLGSARAAEKFDLVVGAAGSETQLTLSTVFLQPAPLPLMPGAVLAKLAADPRVSLAAPIGFGDSASGFPIVGTTTALVAALSPTLAEGAGFVRLGDAVIGADVPLALGSGIKPMHGTAESHGHVHGGLTFRVTGRLASTGTAWDRAILVPIMAVWRLHGMAGGEDHDHGHEDHDHDHEEHDHGSDHDHVDGDAHDGTPAPQRAAATREAGTHETATVDADAPIDERFGAATPDVPAVLVKPRRISDAYRLRQEYRAATTLAVFPAEVLTRLYATLGDARRLLMAIAMGTQTIVVAAILLVTIMHLGNRRRQIGALRALGAPARSIIALVWGELFVLFAVGLVMGIGIGYGAARILGFWLAKTTAVPMPVEFAAEDFLLALGCMAVAAIVSIIPAVTALRVSPATALRNSGA